MNAPARPVRHFVLPATLGGKLHAWRFLIARRTVQAAMLLLFFGTAHWGWKLAGQPLLSGNLSAARLAGAIPLADPFAVLQVLFTRHAVAGEALLGAAIVLAAYLALGGRVFCSWVCPMNVVTDAARWVRVRLAVRDVFAIPPGTRHAVLALAATAQQKPQAVDDKQFGLAKGSVFEAATPAPFEFQDGAKTTRPLEGSGMPVMIPHTIEDDLPITAQENGCVRCHTPTGKKVRGAPPVPPSHVAEGDKPSVSGRRWHCVLCHAPQADVKPLVANTAQ